MPHLKLEKALAPLRVCGVDEAGRGPLAGPVVAAALLFRVEAKIPRGLNDSKQLSFEEREAIYEKLITRELHYAVGIASVEEIDTLNIWGATQLAMVRAVAALTVMPDIALIDGKLIPKNMPCEARPVVGGDGISHSIAAASIIAKVTRDRIMRQHAREYPHYGFEQHVGYGTPHHYAALEAHGPCPLHRRSFAPVRVLIEKRSAA